MSQPAHSRTLCWTCTAVFSGALIFLTGFAAGRYRPTETASTHRAIVLRSPANAVFSLVNSSRASGAEHNSATEALAADSEIAAQYNALSSGAHDELSYAADLCVLTHQLDAEQLFALLEDAESLEQNEGHRHLLRTFALLRLAQRDPHLAVDELTALHHRRQSSGELRDNLFDYLVGVDPAEATRTALAYAGATGEYDATFYHLLPKLLERDPQSVDDLAQTLLGCADADLAEIGFSAAEKYLSLLCNDKRGEAAIPWVESLATSPQIRAKLLQSAVADFAQHEAFDSALLAYRALGTAAEPVLAGALASALVPTRPTEAFQLVAALAPGATRTVCFAEIVPKLLEKQDPTTVFTWLRSLPASADLDPIYPTLAEKLASSDCAQAFACVESMSSGAKYKEAYRLYYAFTWLGTEHDRATGQLPSEIVALWERGMALQAQAQELIPGMVGFLTYKPVETQ